jgi:hypothetical protein
MNLLSASRAFDRFETHRAGHIKYDTDGNRRIIVTEESDFLWLLVV